MSRLCVRFSCVDLVMAFARGGFGCTPWRSPMGLLQSTVYVRRCEKEWAPPPRQRLDGIVTFVFTHTLLQTLLYSPGGQMVDTLEVLSMVEEVTSIECWA